jgi:hypothetical protein
MNESEHKPVKTIVIPAGTMINLSGHEDDAYQILQEDVIAEVLGPAVNSALPIKISKMDSDRTFFLHQPEKKESTSSQ